MLDLHHVDNTPAYLTHRPPVYRAASFVVLARGDIEHPAPDDICDPTRQIFLIRLHELRGDDGGADVRDARALIARALTPARCYCAHDCCGHRSGWAEVEWLTLELVMVTVTTARNY
jgi:hypothetical protein